MKIKALIPARSGSERVVNKNIRPFAGTTLLENKIQQLKRIKCLDGIILNSNDDIMLEIAKRLGIETVKREEYFASSTVSINEVYENIAENFDADIIVYANCTNPLIEDTSIEKAIEFYQKNSDNYDSVNTAHYIKEFLWLNNKAINYSPLKMPKSQNLPDIMALNFAVNILTKENMKKNKSIVGFKPYLFPISDKEAIDIDNQIDFDFALISAIFSCHKFEPLTLSQ